jgi:hypothetical protein
MIRWLWGLWYAQQRRIDLLILWPCCVAAAPTLDLARGAFAMHALADPAWQFLGEDEIFRRIDRLT